MALGGQVVGIRKGHIKKPFERDNPRMFTDKKELFDPNSVSALRARVNVGDDIDCER